MPNKYGAKKTTVDNIVFDSRMEAERYTELKLLVYNGDITDLILQPKFLLQSGFKDRYGKTYRAVYYVSDFQYLEGGQMVIEEVKGFQTPIWRLKKKLFLFKYPEIDLRVISNG